MRTIKIFGMASNKQVKEIQIDDSISDSLSLMEFLIKNNITIASSCGGTGVCARCIVNQNILSCQTSIQEFLNTSSSMKIDIAYL